MNLLLPLLKAGREVPARQLERRSFCLISVVNVFSKSFWVTREGNGSLLNKKLGAKDIAN